MKVSTLSQARLTLGRYLLTSHEAEEYLYQNNLFVIASFEWRDYHLVVDGQPTFAQQLVSPIVTDKFAARMKHHTLRLHITKNMDSLATKAPSAQPSKIPIHPILFVAKDLRAFCSSLRHRLGALCGFAILVGDEIGPKPTLNVLGLTASRQKLKPPDMKIEFRDTRFHVADGILQRDLLGQLSKIISPSLQVSLKGALRLPGDLYIQRTKNAMGPSVISLQGRAWYFFDNSKAFTSAS